jgi:Putative transposase/Transposase zinc-binding domain
MLELADIFRRHSAVYRATHRLLPSQLRALQDIEACRTAFFGGQLKQCDHCQRLLYAYHSCRNRHCPKCHGDQTDRWLQQQQSCLLPGPYFLLTFTLPAELRPLAFALQKKVYGLLMRAAAAALQKLALDPQYLGGQLGALAVLHTWTRELRYHPHVHLLVTGGALSAAGKQWVPSKHAAYLMPEAALARIFRAKLSAALKRAGLLPQVPPAVWRKNWVVHCQAVAQGREVLNYLARYVFRVALSNSRLERFENGQVTFRYRDNRSQQLHRVTLTAEEFIRRFLRHTLPRGFAKVRYYGLFSPAARPQLAQARILLSTAVTAAPTLRPQSSLPAVPVPPTTAPCPFCHLGQLRLLALLPRPRPRQPKVPP